MKKGKPVGFAHPLVVETARQMAGAVYEELAKNNAWYAMNPDQKEFIERAYPPLLESARSVLAEMLTKPSLDEKAKEIIYDALVKDRSLMFGRQKAFDVVERPN